MVSALVPQLNAAVLKGGRGRRGTNKGCPCAAVESRIAKLSLEIAKLRHRVACQEQSCHRRTRCAIPLPRLHCAQTVQALPPCIMYHRTSVLPRPLGLGDRPSLWRTAMLCTGGRGGQSSHGFACAPRRNSGLCHVCTGGKQHKSAERKWARQWSIRPEVPFCHRTRDTKMPVGRPQRCKAVGVQRYASGRR